MATKKLKPTNADLHLSNYWDENHYFWTQGDIWHLECRDEDDAVSLQGLSDTEFVALATKLLSRNLTVRRCSRAFRNYMGNLISIPATGGRWL